jgi:hypothetical protein
MKNIILISTIIVSFIISTASSAKLEKTDKVSKFMDKIKSKQVTHTVDIDNPSLQETEESEGRPIVYEVKKSSRDNKKIAKFSKLVNKPDNMGFNEKKGMYYYTDFDVQEEPLSATDDNVLIAEAKKVIKDLLGKDANRFVFANNEINYFSTKDDRTPKVLSKTLRFTRKLNGRHILDNTSYVSISFAGNMKLLSFEIVDPDIKPLKAVKRMVKLSATEKRLEKYASNKTTAVKNGPKGLVKVSVNTIKSTIGIPSYLCKDVGDKTLLIPNISFYSEYQLENDEAFDNWTHFCIDADYVSNLDDDMIEDLRR